MDASASNSPVAGNPLGGATPDPASVVEAVSAAAASPAAAVNHRDPYTSRAIVTTSNGLTILAYTLNWYAHCHGQPEYMPDWVIGFIWAPLGGQLWLSVKQSLLSKKK